jgi:ribosomal protein L12E/L44/L45/RPP1/RPP2
MSDVSLLVDDDPTRKISALERSYHLRAWLTTLVAQTLQAASAVKSRIAVLAQEAAGLRVQLEDMTSGIESLKQSIRAVDDAIRRQRDEMRAVSAGPAAESARRPQQPAESSEDGRRHSRRKGS